MKKLLIGLLFVLVACVPNTPSPTTTTTSSASTTTTSTTSSTVAPTSSTTVPTTTSTSTTSTTTSTIPPTTTTTSTTTTQPPTTTTSTTTTSTSTSTTTIPPTTTTSTTTTTTVPPTTTTTIPPTTTTTRPPTTTTSTTTSTTTTTTTTTIPVQPQLDPTGKTLPVTNYPIPAGAVFMATTGSDTAAGTQSAPLKTLNAAVNKVANGGTIVVRGGTYRDWLNNGAGALRIANKGFTLQAFPGEAPWFDGADVIDPASWSSNGSTWSRDWSTPSFCGGSYYDYSIPPYTPQRGPSGLIDVTVKETKCMYEDASNDPAYPVAGNPQQMWVNGTRLREVESLAKVTANTFFYDWYARKVYIGVNPIGKQIEMSTRTNALVLGGALTDKHKILGIGFKRYATNGGEMSPLTSAVIYASREAVIENSVFAENAGGGLNLSDPEPGTVIRKSVFAFNGGTGMGANGASKTIGKRNDMLVEQSVFNSSNWEYGGLYCNRACGPAHVKMAHMTGFLYRDNLFENTFSRAPALWCDMDCSDMVAVRNIVRNNGGHGIFYEISNRGIIANNLISNNGGSGVAVASANVKVYNNTIVVNPAPNAQAGWLWDDKRIAPGPESAWPWGFPDLGPNTVNLEFVNNLVSGPVDRTTGRFINSLNASTDPANTQAEEWYEKFDFNAYYGASNQALYGFGATDQIRTVEAFRTLTGFEMNSFKSVSDPFVNRAGGDYRMKLDALTAGTPLPADVASVLGLAAGSNVSRGYFG